MSNEFTATPGTPIDLNKPISLEEYERILNRIVEAGRILANTMGWCGQWLDTLQNLSEDFTNYPFDIDRYDDDGNWLDPSEAEYLGGVDIQPITGLQPRSMFTDEGWQAYHDQYIGNVYAKRLRDIYGRLLAVVHGDGDNEGDVDLDLMNDVFTYIGFPRYTPASVPQVVEINIPRNLYFQVEPGVSEGTINDRVIAAFEAFAGEMGDVIRDSYGDERDISNVYEVEISDNENDSGVSDEDVVSLLYRA